MLRRLFFLLLGLGSIGGLAGLVFFAWLVVFSPGDDIRQDNIVKILAVESPVYYSGGKEKIGVFFETSHRQYIPYDNIPSDFINGIVAAEDSNFFSHHGIDPLGVLRAMWANIRAGRVVQGGSTITQQTAKNLFKRKNRSLISKLKELLFALRLEYHYPKEKILEFYANQFYVSGNGRGLGVAARYFFDKDVTELNLLECAFIAGSVKRPNYYNPFIKSDEERKAKAIARSKQRVRYVLGQMYKNDLIDEGTYVRNINQGIPFSQGKMYFSLNTTMDMVKEAMTEPEIVDALREHGIDNVATSGIKITTSIEKNLQEGSFIDLRKELSRLDVRLRGYDRQAVQDEYLEITRKRVRDKSPGSFHFGRIISIDDEQEPIVWVSFSDYSEAEPDAYIDRKGLMNLVVPLVKYEKNRWSEPKKNDLKKLLGRLEAGDLVYVSVRKVSEEGDTTVLDLEKYPDLQGGLLVMRDGMIKAMVGGMENRYFNRAVSAKRPMGSVVKPLVYSAALQLGWNSIDVLNNERDVFVYQKLPYFPRPDHISPYKGVSMSWAGVHSENLATIWLLYHLSDQLSPGEFRNVVEKLELNQQEDESPSEYRRRIRDEYGVVVDDETYYEVAFERAISELEPDLIFAGRLMEYETISKFHYGRYFDRFFDNIDVDLGLVEDEELGIDELSDEPTVELTAEEKAREKKERKRKEQESEVRKVLLKSNYLRSKKLLDGMNELRASFTKPAEEKPDVFSELAGMVGVDNDNLENTGIVSGIAVESGEEEVLEETKLYRDRSTGSYIYFDKDEVFGEPVVPEDLELPGEQEFPEGEEELQVPIPGLMVAPEPESLPVPKEWQEVTRSELAEILGSFDSQQDGPFWDLSSVDRLQQFWDGVLIDNTLTAGTVQLVKESLDREYGQLKELPPYSPEMLSQVRDFKIMVSLRYVIGLCRAIGIKSDLDPVLSFPLGSNVMNLPDVARAYESLLSGTIRSYGGPESGEGLTIIERIESSDGEIIYEPQPFEQQVLAPETTIAVSDILRRVIKHGTGRAADRKIRLRSKDKDKDRQLKELDARMPVVGKTGTANRFTNASFAGGIPGIGNGGFFSLSEGYVLTTYVGFDDNVPMVRNTTHITGASGALPLWIKVANRILLENDYASQIDLVDISFSGLTEFPLYSPDMGQMEVGVDPEKGGIVSDNNDKGAAVVTFGEAVGTDRIRPVRFFKPYWQLEEGY